MIRLCGSNCPTPDLPHLDARVDWVGDAPVAHGESGRAAAGVVYCLCGRPNYLTCPASWTGEGTVYGLTLGPI